MFRETLNRALLTLEIRTEAPLLIRAGDAGLEPTAAALSPVRTRHAEFGETVFVPGSSLRGVLRSTAEAILRGRRFEQLGVRGACATLEPSSETARTPADSTCASELQGRDLGSASIHNGHCLACRLFGSPLMRGRAMVRDHLPWRPGASELSDEDHEDVAAANALELRNGVSINRISGAVEASGPFDQELVPAGSRFWGEITLVNYQVWQLGLLAAALEEMNLEFAQLGSGKSHGLGVVNVRIVRLVHEQRNGSQEEPCGVERLASPEATSAYGLVREGSLPRTQGRRRGLAQRFVCEGSDAIEAWHEAGLTALDELS